MINFNIKLQVITIKPKAKYRYQTAPCISFTFFYNKNSCIFFKDMVITLQNLYLLPQKFAHMPYCYYYRLQEIKLYCMWVTTNSGMFMAYLTKISQLLPKVKGETWHADLVISLHFHTRWKQCKKKACINQTWKYLTFWETEKFIAQWLLRASPITRINIKKTCIILKGRIYAFSHDSQIIYHYFL
jgi:hypothetical protein